jgi:hypothetical protein
MFGLRNVQVGLVAVGVTATTGAAIYIFRKGREAEVNAESRKKWEALGEDVVVLHHSIGVDQMLQLSPFDLKVK